MSISLLSVLLTAPALTLLGTGQATAAAVSTSPAHYDFLGAQVFTAPGLGSVAVGMPNPRTVKIQHRDEATGTWDRPTLLFRKRGITCGGIDGRTSPGGVVLQLQCDSPYYDDQAPAESRALVTQDLHTWQSKELDGEAYRAPAISPDGRYAAWLAGGLGDYQLWRAGSGFDAPASTTYSSPTSGDETLVVDDAGTVAVIGPESSDEGCVIGVHDRTLAGTETHTVVAGIDPGCTEGSLSNIDADHVAGDEDARESRYVIARSGSSSPWVLAEGRPSEAAGLVDVQGSERRVISTRFLDVTDRPLVALASPDRQHVYTQVYDDAAHTWGPQQLVLDAHAPVCRDALDYADDPRGVFAFALTCRGGTHLLTSPDGRSWQSFRLGDRDWTLSKESLLAAPGRHATTIVSRTGSERVSRTVGGRCDFVFPIGPTSLLRLHGRAADPWPTRVQTSTDGGPWRTVSRLRMPRVGACESVVDDTGPVPTQLILRGDGLFVPLTVRPGGAGGWHVAHTPTRY